MVNVHCFEVLTAKYEVKEEPRQGQAESLERRSGLVKRRTTIVTAMTGRERGEP